MAPALVLAVIVGLFHVSAYVFIRGRAGARLPLLVIAAVLGAWAGDAIGARLAIDPLRVGEFNLVSASLVAWLGIGLVAVLSGLVPERRAGLAEPRVSTAVTRSGRKPVAVGPGVDPADADRDGDTERPGVIADPSLAAAPKAALGAQSAAAEPERQATPR